MTLNIYSQIGDRSCSIGIAAKNGVLIVEFANQLRDRGVEFVGRDRRGRDDPPAARADDSLCTAFGAMPLLLAVGAGAESGEPIGAVVFYGMLVSMVLTLFVVPAVYTLVARNTRSPQYMSRIVDRLLAGGDAAGTASGTAAAHAPHHE